MATEHNAVLSYAALKRTVKLLVRRNLPRDIQIVVADDSPFVAEWERQHENERLEY